MRVELPWPNKLLWPNGSRGNHGAVAGQKKRHRQWAFAAALEALQRDGSGGLGLRPLPVIIHVHAKPRGPLPDRDNCVAAAKALLDGIADALKLNDAEFDTPVVWFAAERTGRFVIELGLPVARIEREAA